jgi:hypothetical protein
VNAGLASDINSTVPIAGIIDARLGTQGLPHADGLSGRSSERAGDAVCYGTSHSS